MQFGILKDNIKSINEVINYLVDLPPFTKVWVYNKAGFSKSQQKLMPISDWFYVTNAQNRSVDYVIADGSVYDILPELDKLLN